MPTANSAAIQLNQTITRPLAFVRVYHQALSGAMYYDYGTGVDVLIENEGAKGQSNLIDVMIICWNRVPL